MLKWLGGDGVNSGYWPALVMLLTAPIFLPLSAKAQSPPEESRQRLPKPIEPPHKPAQQGFRFAMTVGFGLIANGSYSYKTAVTMPDGSVLTYNGKQRSAGATLGFGAALTPPGAFRRFTVGFDLNLGGVDVSRHPVIPSNTGTPFSQDNLNVQVAQKSLLYSPWHPFVSPYIEHEIGSILQNRIRLGYEYFATSGSVNGTFAVNQQLRSNLGRYSVGFSQSSHTIRLSVHNDSWFDDPNLDHDHPPPKRRAGFLQQVGVLVGTDGRVVVFIGVGPVWTF